MPHGYPRPFQPSGLLALERSAFGMLMLAPYEPPPILEVDGVVIVPVRGPLMHHPDGCSDSYDAVRERVMGVLRARPRKLVLSIDSPGGAVSGCFALVRDIRAAANAAGVELVAHVDGNAASAAYAVACMASRIVITETSLVGSIGVMEGIVSTHRRDAGSGVDFEVVASGRAKTAGHALAPAPLSRDARTEIETRVDHAAAVFAELVAECRGLSVEGVLALEGRVLTGRSALEARLADDVMTLDQLIASLSGAATLPPKIEEEAMEVRKMLQSIIDDEKRTDEEKADAKTALAALEKPEAKAEADADKKPEDKPAAPPSDEKKEPEASTTEKRLALLEQGQKATLAAAEATERAALLATRPDLDADTRKLLATTPIAQVREFVTTAARRSPKLADIVGGAVNPTRGEPAQEIPALDAAEARSLDIAMGLHDGSTGIRYEGKTQVLGVMTRIAARAELERRAKAATTPQTR